MFVGGVIVHDQMQLQLRRGLQWRYAAPIPGRAFPVGLFA
jgi:hypothetical protein